MNRIFTWALALAAGLVLGGCVSHTFTSAGLGGRILDARTDQPIASATVMVTYARDPFTEESKSRQAITGADGDFNFTPDSAIRWGSRKDVADARIEVPMAITVQSPGYESFAYFFRRSPQETGTSRHFVLAPVAEDGRSYRLMPLGMSQANK